MEQRTFPDTSLAASAIGIGCNNFGMRTDAAASADVVDAAISSEVTFFDTAAMYGGGKSEEFLGAALGARRGEVVIATKFPMTPKEGACAPAEIRRECEESLARLGTDYIDLYQQHYPDPATPLTDILGTLAELRDEGKIREVGHSNFTAEMHDEAQAVGADGQIRYVSSQVEWSMLNRTVEESVIPAAQRNNVGVLPYFPLASGLLTGKHQRNALQTGSRLDVGGDYFKAFLTDENWTKVDALAAWSADNNLTLLDLAFTWLLSQASVTSVIAGATHPDQIIANAASGARTLTPGQLAEINILLS
jgi:aryl-alcohol dehydrogenase-like predicted oxidoreductase